MVKRNFCRLSTLFSGIAIFALLSAFLLRPILPAGKENATTQSEKVYVSGILVERSLDDLNALAEVIAIGTITDQSDAFQIKSASGQTANFIDYEFEVSNCLRGAPDIHSLTIRIQGGVVGNREEIYEHNPNLEVGQSYLLFLYQPGRGGSFNTEGNYYYILGLTQGTFQDNGNGSYISKTGVLLEEDALASFISTYSIQADSGESYFRQEYIENQKRNLENGVITQEQYDYLIDNIDGYATVVE